jgi:hypothetical protein
MKKGPVAARAPRAAPFFKSDRRVKSRAARSVESLGFVLVVFIGLPPISRISKLVVEAARPEDQTQPFHFLGRPLRDFAPLPSEATLSAILILAQIDNGYLS